MVIELERKNELMVPFKALSNTFYNKRGSSPQKKEEMGERDLVKRKFSDILQRISPKVDTEPKEPRMDENQRKHIARVVHARERVQIRSPSPSIAKRKRSDDLMENAKEPEKRYRSPGELGGVMRCPFAMLMRCRNIFRNGLRNGLVSLIYTLQRSLWKEAQYQNCVDYRNG